MTYEQHKEKLSSIPNQDLIKIAKEQLSKLCQTGGRSFRMCVPVQIDDTDVILGELISRFEAASNLSPECEMCGSKHCLELRCPHCREERDI